MADEQRAVGPEAAPGPAVQPAPPSAPSVEPAAPARVESQGPSIEELQSQLQSLKQEVDKAGQRHRDLEEENKFYREEVDRAYAVAQQQQVRRPVPAPTAPQAQEVPVDPFTLNEDDVRELAQQPHAVLSNLGRRFAGTTAQLVLGALQQQAQRQQYNQALRGAFYRENQDLVGHEALVGAVAEVVEQENPRLQKHLLLPRIAERTKAELDRIRNGGQKRPPAPPAPMSSEAASGGGAVNFGGTPTGGQPRQPKRTEAEQELLDLAPEFFNPNQR